MIFERVVCCVDATPESLAAARQCGRLASGAGRVLLISVVELEVAVHAGFAADEVIAELREDAQRAIEAARREIEPVHSVETVIVEGRRIAEVEAALRRERATVVGVGSHGHRRGAGIITGSLATAVLHDAPCAVLVARGTSEPAPFPARIVVGVDGSRESEAAAAVAGALRERFGATVEEVAATGGKSLDIEMLRAAHPSLVMHEGKPVDALLEHAATADLIVIGSRGLHGVRALGSVGERVAHQAGCSVLVVR